MSVNTVIGVAIALCATVAIILSLSRHHDAGQTFGRSLRLLAFGSALGVAVPLLPDTASDGGAAVGYLLGVPVVAAGLPLVADLTRRAVRATTALGALVMLSWGLLLGFEDGIYLMIPALVLGVAAIASIAPSHGLPPEPTERPSGA